MNIRSENDNSLSVNASYKYWNGLYTNVRCRINYRTLSNYSNYFIGRGLINEFYTDGIKPLSGNNMYTGLFQYSLNNNDNKSLSNQLLRDKPVMVERIKNKKGNNNTMNIPSVKSIIDKVENYTCDYAFESIKKYFGKEFIFYNYRETQLIEIIVDKFIKKYDKNFLKYAVSHGNIFEVTNVKTIFKIDENTYVYIATGDKIENKIKFETRDQRDLYIYIFGKKMHKYVKRLEKIIYKYYNNVEIGIFNVDSSNNDRYDDGNGKSSESIDVIYSPLKERDINTIFYSHSEKELVINHIDKFIQSKEFYEEKQLLYKTGILLYGEPGTGKTSFIKTIATKYKRSIVNINISNLRYINLNELSQSINADTYREYMIVLEDIDTLFLNRNSDTIDKDDNAVINKLLQFLDSNTSPNNVIFIATTNHIERLDDALLREGRFDLKVHVQPLDEEGTREFGKSFGLNTYQINDIITELNNEYPELIGNYNQSRLQARMLSKIENKSIEDIKNIYGEMNE